MDLVFKSWLECQHAEGMKLAATSDVLTLHPAPGLPRAYFARFASPTMVREQGAVSELTGFDVLVRFPLDYLRSVPNPALVVALLSPQSAFHPNVAPPFVCIGDITPGTGLCELLYQIFEIMTFRKLTPREDDALNKDACAWARNHMDLFPLTSRPLRRSLGIFNISEIAAGASF